MNSQTFPFPDTWAKTTVNARRHQPRKIGRSGCCAHEASHAGQISDVRRGRNRPVRSARRPERCSIYKGSSQQLGVKGRGKYWIVVTSQEKLSEMVSGLDDRRTRIGAPDGPIPVPGASGAVGHLRGHQPPRAREELRRRTSLGALFEANRGRLVQNTRIPSDIRLPEVAPAILRRPLSPPALPDRPDHPDRVGTAHAERRQPARRRGEPHDHQAGPTAPDQSANEARVQGCRRARPPRPRLRPHRGQYLVGHPRQDRLDPLQGRPSQGAGGGQDRLPSPVREERRPLGREHGRLPARFRVGQFVPRGGQGRPRRTDKDVADPRGRRRLPDPNAGGRRLEPDPLLDQPEAGRREQALCRGPDRVLVAHPDIQPRRHEVLQGGPDVQWQGGSVGRHHLQCAVRRRPGRRRGALRGSAGPQPERPQEHLLGRHPRRGNPQRDAGGLPLAADDRDARAATCRRRTALPSSPTRRAANAGTWTN